MLDGLDRACAGDKRHFTLRDPEGVPTAAPSGIPPRRLVDWSAGARAFAEAQDTSTAAQSAPRGHAALKSVSRRAAVVAGGVPVGGKLRLREVGRLIQDCPSARSENSSVDVTTAYADLLNARELPNLPTSSAATDVKAESCPKTEHSFVEMSSHRKKQQRNEGPVRPENIAATKPSLTSQEIGWHADTEGMHSVGPAHSHLKSWMSKFDDSMRGLAFDTRDREKHSHNYFKGKER
eukprot:TRINITY_DN61661_c0_g1_i1.p1 TRINITY_DN61661_c0_g1~~TRINITY_DN61661_c0_g1_i1.p1  ORF type:complete len:236 (+),score=41.87 TRINITY_DN61661_c0_g1_i1:84-791(+)